ncbi:unnamed protein product [Rhizoctonia solani]|uniref:Uncharacterized protein n=1 Tax=Rhizoctonia solani TaxID=456999 RepID=A0A8H2WGR6_9AGAM|nr:unnamed protein product [Rhizoctonia solani]
MTSVETSINYFSPPTDGSKPYLWTAGNLPNGALRRNWEPLPHNVQVQNIQGQESSLNYKLDTTGFEFHRIPNKANINFDDEANIRRKYYTECTDNIKSITRASRVLIFDHTLRKSRSPGSPEVTDNRPAPVKLVHVNQSNESAKQHVHLYLPESEVPTLLSKRFQIINLWRPVSNPASRCPLALCDFRSVRAENSVPFTLKYQNRDDEALVFSFDSLQDKSVATFAPHTAIDDSTIPSDAPDRQSIEIYALVFYD